MSSSRAQDERKGSGSPEGTADVRSDSCIAGLELGGAYVKHVGGPHGSPPASRKGPTAAGPGTGQPPRR